MRPLDEFKRDIAAYLPGLLVLFDMADVKRRNCHLGHQVVDHDIEELDQLVRLSVGSSGFAKRVDGDKWLAVYKVGNLKPVAALLSAYHKEQEFLVGWGSTGKKDSEIKVIERTVRSKICRSLRCIYCSAATRGAAALIEKMVEHNHGLPVDIPHSLSDVANMKKSDWSCVTNYPDEWPLCPFCERREFDWDDGDSSVYSGSGICKACGAQVDIQGIEDFS